MLKKKNIYAKYLSPLAFLLLFLAFGFIFRKSLEAQWRFLMEKFYPCATPISYSIGAFDTQFGISKEDFIKAVWEAEAIWEKPINKDLFVYVQNGGLPINLIYDYRQDTTQTLQKLGLKVDQSNAFYEELKNKYESMTSQLELDESVFEARAAAFNARKSIYENDVRQANKRNRQKDFFQEEYDRLKAEGDFLESEVVALNIMDANLQKEVDDINVIVRALNDMSVTLNLNVDRYNEIGESFSGEIVQGLYENHGEGGGISIFQYDSYEKLVRVLAHELGHALYIDHLDDPDAIMYRLNQGDNDTVTPSDLSALKVRCGIK